jgi:hypothetical protein
MTLFLVYQITINTHEPKHYSSHETKSLQGIYDSIEKATDKVDKLHENSRNAEEQYPEYSYIENSAIIEEQILNI